MKRPALPLLLLACVLSIPVRSDEKPNLLKNGSFEAVEPDGIPTGWKFATPVGETADFKVVTDKPREGRNCLRIAGKATWAAAVSDPIPIDRAKKYTLTGALRVHHGQGTIKFDYFKDGQYLGQTLRELMGPTGDWKEMAVRSELGDFPAATHLVATVAALGDHECWFDALALHAQ